MSTQLIDKKTNTNNILKTNENLVNKCLSEMNKRKKKKEKEEKIQYNAAREIQVNQDIGISTCIKIS